MSNKVTLTLTVAQLGVIIHSLNAAASITYNDYIESEVDVIGAGGCGVFLYLNDGDIPDANVRGQVFGDIVDSLAATDIVPREVWLQDMRKALESDPMINLMKSVHSDEDGNVSPELLADLEDSIESGFNSMREAGVEKGIVKELPELASVDTIH